MNRQQQLRDLEASLSRLIGILQLDTNCRWTRHFESCLEEVKHLVAGKFSQDDLSTLSASIMRVYGGMGSFSDYVPGVYDPVSRKFVSLRGTEQLGDVSTRVYRAAQALRIVGNAP
jgi:hypothetical protein